MLSTVPAGTSGEGAGSDTGGGVFAACCDAPSGADVGELAAGATGVEADCPDPEGVAGAAAGAALLCGVWLLLAGCVGEVGVAASLLLGGVLFLHPAARASASNSAACGSRILGMPEGLSLPYSFL
jgi:hypothetical protein